MPFVVRRFFSSASVQSDVVHSVFSRLCRDCITEELNHRIIYHPFNKAMSEGSLPGAIFKKYLKHDHKYLDNFADVLALTSTRAYACHRNDEGLMLHRLSLYIRNVERAFFDKYGDDSIILMDNDIENTAIEAYTHYHLCQAKNAALEEAIASFSACFYLYRQLAFFMTPHAPGNPYARWIRSYSSPNFIRATDDIIACINQWELTEDAFQMASKAFAESISYEISFWDSMAVERFTKETSEIVSLSNEACPHNPY